MRIGIDLRALAHGRQSGVEGYAQQFLSAVFAACPEDTFVLFVNAWRNQWCDTSWAERFSHVKIVRRRIPNKILNMAMWYCGWPRLDRLMGGVDMVFLPNINFCAVSPHVPVVVTIHDLSFEHVPQTFSRKQRLWHYFVHPRALVRRASRIIAVSEATASDVCRTYQCARSKIAVIPSAVRDVYAPLNRNDLRLVSVQKKYRLPYRFILFLGTIEPRKNIGSLITAYTALRKKHPDTCNDVHVVIAGNAGWCDTPIYDAIAASPYHDMIHVIGHVDEEDKPALYTLATVFAYPSFFEGFGFPPLEAMACCVPVITSQCTSLPEVVGSAAIMIDPDRPEELCHALHMTLTDAALRTDMIRRGIAQAGQFSWDRAAQQWRDLCAQLRL